MLALRSIETADGSAGVAVRRVADGLVRRDGGAVAPRHAPTAAPRRALEFAPLDQSFGVELRGLDTTAPIPPALAETLRATLDRHLLLILRGAAMTPESQIAFTAALGTPARHPLALLSHPRHPAIVVEAPGQDDRDAHWHADLSWAAAPNRISILSAADIPEGAWATEFASGVAAYARLDPWLKDRIEFLEAEHDHPRRIAAGLPPVTHPLVTVDPRSGRRALLLGGGTARRVVGLSDAEGADLLHRLHAAATHPSVVLRHAWREGDLVLWDNLAVMHRARFAAPGRLHRTMVRGERPVGPRDVGTAWVSAG
jgi:taurine dioxygenase